jgi:hypothetical protein
MLVELGVRSQNMVSDEEIIVLTRLHGLNKCANGTEIGTDFSLRENGADVHSGNSLVVICIVLPDTGAYPTCLGLALLNFKGTIVGNPKRPPRR